MNNELIHAMRTETAEQIAESIYQRFAGDIRDDQALEIAEAIVAARDKPEDVVTAKLTDHYWHIAGGTKTILTFTIDEPEAFFGARYGEEFALAKEPKCPPE